VGETYRVIRNALRYQLSNLYDFDPAKHTVPDDQLTSLDRWILWKLSQVEADVAAAYDKFEFHVVYQKLSQFAAVELSAMYHDLVKDRLYTDAAGSRRRRSTQTALNRLVTSLCQMLSPILVFTSGEAWEFVPARKVQSVHLQERGAHGLTLSEQEERDFQALISVRTDKVLPDLEQARKGGLIGKSLEAKIVLEGDKETIGFLRDNVSVSLELFQVSQLEFRERPEEKTEFLCQVTKAEGQKCARCWHYETDVGSNPDHPTICSRCVEAVTAH
jgi:isoleucyl-tRNA synthetase